MSTTNKSRRNAIKSLAGATASVGAFAASQSSAKTLQRNRWDFDINKPEDAVKVYAKMTGSLIKERVFLQYYGQIFSVAPGQKHIQLFRLKGLVRSDWIPNDDGSYSYENYDHGLFCDFETGKVLETYENPITGKLNEPLHYKSGLIASTIGLGESQENPTTKEWHTMSNQISASNSKTNDFKNPLAPERWGDASTGETVNYSYVSSYMADLDDVANSALNTVECDHTWTFNTAYPAWMLMGDRPGNVVWQWAARKFSGLANVDPYIADEIEKRAPKFFTDEAPWPRRSDGWTQYTRERSPILR